MEEFEKYLPRPISPENIAVYASSVIMALKTVGEIGDLSLLSHSHLLNSNQAALLFVVPAVASAVAARGLWKFQSYGLYALGLAYGLECAMSFALLGILPVGSFITGLALYYWVSTQRSQLEESALRKSEAQLKVVKQDD